LRLPVLRPLGQAGTTYIIAEGPTGLYLIDQHAAHERVLFERVRAGQVEAAPARQGLLEPVPLTLTPAQRQVIATYRAELGQAGFEVEAFGPGGSGGYLLRALPPLFDARADPPAAVAAYLELVLREDGPRDPWERVAASLACHAAVRAGQGLADSEMRDLLRQLEECELPQTCPHGRPTMLHLSVDELARRFGRR
jgi:DNA mismatch repair protein MutL